MRPGGPRVAVLRPQTYMNDSGDAAGPARGSLKVPIERTVVVHDEIDLPFGTIRSRLGGGGAGPKGGKRPHRGPRGAPLWGGGGGRRAARLDRPRDRLGVRPLPLRRAGRRGGGADLTRRPRDGAPDRGDPHRGGRAGGSRLMATTTYNLEEGGVALIRLDRP